MTYPDWNVFDWMIATIGLLCLIRGAWRGGIPQVFGIAGVMGGFLIAAYFHESLGRQFDRHVPMFSGSAILTFLILFFLTWFCAGCLGFWLSRALRRKGLATMDRLLGATLGLVKATILAVILISFMTLFFPTNNPLLTDSKLAPYVQRMAKVLVKTTPSSLRKSFEEKQKEVEKYWSNQEKPAQKGT